MQITANYSFSIKYAFTEEGEDKTPQKMFTILHMYPTKSAVFSEKFQPVFDSPHFQKNILEKFGDPSTFACVKHIIKEKKICNINIT